MDDRQIGIMTTLPVTGGHPSAGAGDARLGRGEVLVAAAAFAALCVAVLTRSAQLLEPDDYAYRASIIALT